MIHTITIPTPFAVGDVNAFLVKGDALSLFDAGPKTEEAYQALKRGLNALGYQFRDIEQVFLTHHHPDHAGWIDAFDRAEILGHPYNNFWLKRDKSFFEYHDQFYIDLLIKWGAPEKYFEWVPKMKKATIFLGERTIDKTLNDGDDIPGHYGWKAIESLGHAQSHLAFYDERNRQMIGGDLILQKVSSNPLTEPPLDRQEREKSLLQYNNSLKKLLTMPIERVYAGHGQIVTDVERLVPKRLQEQHERAMYVYQMLEKSEHTVFELTKMLFPKVYQKETGLTLSETVGQVDYLIENHYITPTKREETAVHYKQL